jgi:hypothetical protein
VTLADPPEWPEVKRAALVALSLWVRYLLSFTSEEGAHSGSVEVRTEDDPGEDR